MKIIISGAVANYDLADMMDIDLEASHDELHHSSHIMSSLGNSMPGFGIVAAVLGVVIYPWEQSAARQVRSDIRSGRHW